MAERTLGVLPLLDLLKALRSLGADPRQLRRAVGLPPNALRDLGARVRGSYVEDIMREAEHRLGDPLVGLHDGERARPRGVLAYLVLFERIEELAIALETRAARATERAKVADVVRTMTISGVRVDRTRVARRLGMSPRTLQRALAREGVTFKEVRDGVLWDGVHGLLANPECRVQAVAMQAGFADSAAFSKAFRRRMGCSPSGYRKRLAG